MSYTLGFILPDYHNPETEKLQTYKELLEQQETSNDQP